MTKTTAILLVIILVGCMAGVSTLTDTARIEALEKRVAALEDKPRVEIRLFSWENYDTSTQTHTSSWNGVESSEEPIQGE